MVWYGRVQYGTAWYGVVICCGMARLSMAQHGTISHCLAPCGMAEHDTVQHGTAWHSPAHRGTVPVKAPSAELCRCRPGAGTMSPSPPWLGGLPGAGIPKTPAAGGDLSPAVPPWHCHHWPFPRAGTRRELSSAGQCQSCARAVPGSARAVPRAVPELCRGSAGAVPGRGNGAAVAAAEA